MEERIKELRKALGLNQQSFADRISVSRSALASYETGNRQPLDVVVSQICKEFNVSEQWLRTGEGEMFEPEPDDLLGKLVREYDLDPLRARFMRSFLELDTDEMQSVLKFMKACVGDEVAAEEAAYAKRYQNATDAIPSASSTTEDTEAV